MKSAHAANLKRLQDWIALPTIAAEKRNVAEVIAQNVEFLERKKTDGGEHSGPGANQFGPDVFPEDEIPF